MTGTSDPAKASPQRPHLTHHFGLWGAGLVVIGVLAADISGQRMTAAVGLIKALGGGWTDSTTQSQVQFRSFSAAQSQNEKLDGNH